MKAAVAALLVAVTGHATSSVAGLSAMRAGPTSEAGDPTATLAAFEKAHPGADIDVGASYAGRLELLDPAAALPTWHKHARDEAVRVQKASLRCPPPAAPDIADAALAKAYAWHERTCTSTTPPEDGPGLDEPPFMHPSGTSLEELIVNAGPLPMDRLPADGVVELRLDLDDGAVSEGFVITRGLATTAHPVIRHPAPSASLKEGSIEVGWAPFRSPEYAPFEHRGVVLHVQRGRDGSMAWEFATETPDERTEVKLGGGEGVPKAPLAPGDYWLSVTAGETRSFGPVMLLRASRTIQPLHVVR